jgi:hypothetical protein
MSFLIHATDVSHFFKTLKHNLSLMSWSWSRDQDIKTFGLKTETKTKTFFLKTETKTKTFFFKTETKTKTSESGLETVSRPRHVSRHHIPGNWWFSLASLRKTTRYLVSNALKCSGSAGHRWQPSLGLRHAT